jgi:hypothetical protein
MMTMWVGRYIFGRTAALKAFENPTINIINEITLLDNRSKG